MAGRRIHPPMFKDGDDFYEWEREIEIWTMVTDIPEDKQAAAIYLSLEGKARECCKSIKADELKGNAGKVKLMDKLKELYAVDNEQRIYQAYEEFENYARPTTGTMTDFLNEWERRYNQLKAREIVLPPAVLAYRLLKSANLSSEKQALVRATISKLTLEDMKKQIKAIFDSSAISDLSEQTNAIKLEQDAMYTQSMENDCEEVFYSRNKFVRGRGGFRGSRGRGNNTYQGGSRGHFVNQHTEGADASGYTSKSRKTNPLTRSGLPSRCAICESIFHWAKDCPHKDRVHQTMFTKDIDIGAMNNFVHETLNQAVLDSGCSKTVCGEKWYKNFVESSASKQSEIKEKQCKPSTFRFGDGRGVTSKMTVILPVTIGHMKVNIETDVVEADIPLLLSKYSMKKADTTIDFSTDMVTMFGEKIKLNFASSGHYMVPLFPEHEILTATVIEGLEGRSLKKNATKLHLQFGHASGHRIIQLLKDAGNHDEDLFKIVNDVVEECDICKLYHKNKSRPVVGFNLARDFNEVVSMDIKFIESHGILHLIDNATKFSSAAVLKSKRKEEIVEKIFQNWIQIFGSPDNFFSDNGGEFNNELMRELGELLNTRILTTAAESPWSNGITERHNALLAGMVEKVREDTKCSLEIAVAWSVSAKNSLKNVHGFSPNQLVFGRNPNVPTVMNGKPPAHEGTTSSELIAGHLNAMHAARKSYIESEASEKLRRALRKKGRTSTVHTYKTGEEIYYKRKNSKRWHGPGVVIGGINKQVFVKHGGSVIRVSPCHLQHAKRYVSESNENETKSENEPRTNEYDGQDMDQNMDIASQNEHDDAESETDVINDATHDLADQAYDSDNGAHEIDRHETFPNDSSASCDIQAESVHDTDVNDENQIDMNIAKEPRALRNLRAFNKAGKKEDILLSSTDNVKQKESNPPKASRIKYKLSEDDEWVTANVLTDNINEILFLQTSQHFKQAPEPLITSDINEWEYANEEILAVNVDTSDVLEAKMKEIENLKSHNIFTEVPREENKERTIGSRWVITEKFKDGEKVTKARLVAKGFQEETDLKRDSPTCLKENLRIVVAIAASEKWKIKSLDIKSAFLQGKEIEREVYLIPPPEASDGRTLWKLNKVIYGLSDASRMWYLKVKEVLEQLGMKMSIYDEALFYYKEVGNLCGLIAIHVDDFLHVGNKRFEETVIYKIKELFEISQEHDQFFNYLGLEIAQISEGITFSQFGYIDQLTPLEGEITKTDLKSKIGQLAWVAGQTRPDISFDVCHASVNQANENNDSVKRINKCIKRLKAENHMIKFIPIDFTSAKIICFADAAFANLHNGASQGGFIVFLECKNKCVPLFWQSKKLKRVVKSTLSAETMALMEGAEHCFLLKSIIKEILNVDLPITVITDSKSLKDCLSTSKTLEDKRLKVDICVVRDYLKKGEIDKVCWISTEKQLADSLTKSGANPAKLLEVLQSARLQLD